MTGGPIPQKKAQECQTPMLACSTTIEGDPKAHDGLAVPGGDWQCRLRPLDRPVIRSPVPDLRVAEKGDGSGWQDCLER